MNQISQKFNFAFVQTVFHAVKPRHTKYRHSQRELIGGQM